MVNVKRAEPVGQHIEERESLHLREPSEIHVCSSLLHVHDTSELLLRLLHRTVLCSGIKDVRHGVILFFRYTKTAYVEVAVFYQRRHNVAFYRGGVLFRIHAEEHLLLKVEQFPHHVFVLTDACNALFLFLRVCAACHGEHPSDECFLSYSAVKGISIYIHEDIKLVDVEIIHCGKHNCTHNHLYIRRVYCRRQQDLLHVGSLFLSP